MKKLFHFSILIFVLTLSVQQQSFACFFNATITGPEGRCAATPGVATTYTGTHNFSSSGCTIYAWTIAGGNITGPSGLSVTNGTLCLTENISCFSLLDGGCTLAGTNGTVASGNGAAVTVSEITVREDGNRNTISRSDNIRVDNVLYTPRFISRDLNPSSGTYTANFNEGEEPCPTMQVRWTRDGNFVGTGNPINIGLGFCETGTICATVVEGGLSSGERCTGVNGEVFTGEISGPGTAVINVVQQYTIQSGIPLTSIQWYTNPSFAAIIFGPSAETTSLVFPGPPLGTIQLCVDITNTCGDSYTECKNINVVGGDNTTDPKGGIDDHLFSQTTKNQIKTDKMNIMPTLVDQQQDLQIELPELAEPATLSIMDMNGKVVLQQEVSGKWAQVSSKGLQAGMYVLIGQTSQWRSSQKFVVK